jgi:hypothetical protein
MAEAGNWLGRSALLFWEFPQNALGVGKLAFEGARRNVKRVELDRERILVELDGGAAVSLGLFVFWTRRDNRYVPVGPENRDHEYGHTLQSRWLGPLYLPLVGVPSTLRVVYAVAFRELTGRRWPGYYAGYPERWADALGGVDPTQRPPP